MRYLGLDLGSKTIGVALSDEEGWIASPLKTIARVSEKRDVAAVAQIIVETTARGVVIGLPLSLSGEEGEAAASARQFGERLARTASCSVEYWDERFSTVSAEQALIEGGRSRAQRKKNIDNVAAALVLQSYLEFLRQRNP